MPEQYIMCIECLRVIVEDHHISLQKPIYGLVGTNLLSRPPYKVSRGDYVVNGTHLCAFHALPIYSTLPKYVIQETA